MSESEDGGGPGNREVAYRLFAAEFDDADLSYSESDEERAPNYVVTPTGARVNRLFVVGVLTEVETVSEDYLRARVVDPTGPFVVYAGQYQPEALAFLDGADTPTFVAVTGKARTFQPEDSDRVYTSVRPESINEVDADARDRWVVGTAERTVDRVATAAAAIDSGLEGDSLRAALEANGVDDSLAAGLPIALDHYGTTGEYLAAVRELSLDAARVVAGDIDEVEPLTAAPDAGTDDPVPSLVEDPLDLDAADLDEGADEKSSAPAADPDEDREPTGTATGGERSGTDATAEESAAESTPETVSDEDEAVAADDEAGGSETASTGTEPAEAGTTDAEAATDADATADAATETESDDETDADESLEDFDPEFELDEEERDEIESEFGTEFQSGTEVDEPGEADIETPDEPEPTDAESAEAEPAEVEPATEEGAEGEGTADASDEAEATSDAEEAAAAETDEAADAAADEDEASDAATDEDDAGDAATDDEFATAEAAEDDDLEDVDLEDAVVDAMGDLDEGDGADREAVLDAVVDRTGADADEVDDAIQEALMGGRCYEPADDRLKPI